MTNYGPAATEQLLSAASAAGASVVELIEAARGEYRADLAASLAFNEVGEKLADALQTTLTLTLPGLTGEDAEIANQVLGSLSRFLEGWAG